LKFFKKEDRQFKANYDNWLEESKQIFNYDSDQEETVVEEIGAETSKVSLLEPSLANKTMNMDVEGEIEANINEEESDGSDDESF
jgi:hypothetical protein